jgi:hypothetical protein
MSFPARIEGAHSDCAASASKKDSLAASPSHPSERARCASTGDQQAALPHSFPNSLAYSPRVAWSILDCARRTSTFRACAFREQEDDKATLSPLYSKNFLTPALI